MLLFLWADCFRVTATTSRALGIFNPLAPCRDGARFSDGTLVLCRPAILVLSRRQGC
jgi:hypothetical protein